ncbi:MAG: hypothetical protein JWO12_3318, partial [Frankiales bacterium]|nr:hypothetical protein [Frankiales bacterium]
CVGLDLTVTKSALTTDHRTYLWGITKNVDQTTRTTTPGGSATFNYTVTVTPGGTTDDGWSVAGQITVHNPNHWEPITADITDVVDSGGGADCRVANGTSVVVKADATVVLDYLCSFTSKPKDGTNTATATWNAASAATPHGSATGTAAVVFVPSSSTNETITVVDDKTDPANPVTLGTATYGAGPKSFTYSLVKQGSAGTCARYTNTAMIRETKQAASQTVAVCAGQALGVSATSTGSFDRTYLWAVDKSVDQTTATADAGAKVTYNYTVTATPSGLSDGGYALGGSVTVTNPNDWEDVTADVTVSTDLGGGAVCTVTDGAGRSVSAGGQLVLAYSCTFTSAPATSGNVTAGVTWNAGVASTSVGSAEAVTPTTLLLDGETNKTVTVTDDKTDPKNPVTLGTATFGTDPTVFTYAVTKTAGKSGCTTYTNTAALVEPEQTASQDVQLCTTVFTGGGGTVVVPPPATGGGGLPFTGDFSGLLLRWALGLLLAGGLVVLVSRRRSQG